MKTRNEGFYKLYDKCLSRAKFIESFIEEINLIHARDSLISRIVLETFCRISSVLNLSVDDIDKVNCKLKFKNGGNIKEIIISNVLMNDLEKHIYATDYLRCKNNYIFISSSGKQLTRSRLNYSLQKIGNKFAPALELNPEFLRDVGWAIKMKLDSE